MALQNWMCDILRHGIGRCYLFFLILLLFKCLGHYDGRQRVKIRRSERSDFEFSVEDYVANTKHYLRSHKLSIKVGPF
jgi:hypothetical protein